MQMILDSYEGLLKRKAIPLDRRGGKTELHKDAVKEVAPRRGKKTHPPTEKLRPPRCCFKRASNYLTYLTTSLQHKSNR